MRDPLPHVLVVDDDASIREALGAVLRRLFSPKTHPADIARRSTITLNAADRP